MTQYKYSKTSGSSALSISQYQSVTKSGLYSIINKYGVEIASFGIDWGIANSIEPLVNVRGERLSQIGGIIWGIEPSARVINRKGIVAKF